MMNTYNSRAKGGKRLFSLAKSISLLLFALFIYSYGSAQITCYSFSQSKGVYTPITGGTVLGTGTLDDNGWGNISITFPFTYLGSNFTTVGISCNGYLTFGAATPPTFPRNLLGNTTINTGVAALGSDLRGSSASSEVRYEVLGATPNRVFVAQWYNYGDYDFPTGIGDFNFQVRLYETTNAIEVVYGVTDAFRYDYYESGLDNATGSQTNARDVIEGYNDWETSDQSFSTNALCDLDIGFGPPNGLTFRWEYNTTLQANFSMPDSAFTGTVVTMTNANKGSAYINDWDINNDGIYDALNVPDLQAILTPAGSYPIKLRTKYCSLIDSVVKTIQIVDPTAVPDADFVSSSNDIDVYGGVDLIDLSNNGPTDWEWEVYDSSDLNKTITDPVLVGNDPYVNKNPFIYIDEPGKYTVCLTATNVIGASTKVCKYDYITVRAIDNFDMGPVDESDLMAGQINDDGGPNGNYDDNNVTDFLIQPCNADTIKLNFMQFRLSAGDALLVYDGEDPLGKALHPSGGFTGTTNPGELIATSGSMFLYFTTNGSGNDSGFQARWTSVAGTGTAVAAFEFPADTLYPGVEYTITNTSTSPGGDADYIWGVNGSSVAFTRDLIHTFDSVGKYSVTLDIDGCNGSSSYEDSIVVALPTNRVTLDFTADKQRPRLTETVTFTATSDLATNYKWNIFPNTYTIISGTDSTYPLTVRFNTKGAYTVTLTGWHKANKSGTQRSVSKVDYIIVVDYCLPGSTNKIADIGISNFRIEDMEGKILIDNPSATGVDGYTNYNGIFADLTFGRQYKVTLQRPTNLNLASRKIWLDLNIDGDFDDAGELIGMEPGDTTMSFSANFRIPSIDSAFKGKTVIRAGMNYKNMPYNACSNVTVGEYEDYVINLVTDLPAKIDLIGGDTIYTEVGESFVDPWVIAMDDSEGDITSRVTDVSNVDTAYTGIYTVTYSVRDASGNITTAERTVYVVVDATMPVITIIGGDTVKIQGKTQYMDQGATAMDNKDGDLTPYIDTKNNVNTEVLGTYTVEYTVADAQGNIATKARVVQVVDEEKPMILAHKSDQVQIGKPFIESEYVSAQDEFWGTIAYTRSGDMVNSDIQGDYTVVYKATDPSGNEADSMVRTYHVQDFTIPEMIFNQSLLNDTFYTDVKETFNAPAPILITDEYDPILDLRLETQGSVNINVLGVYPLVYTLRDAANNSSTKTIYVKVVDRGKPSITGAPIYVKTGGSFNPMEGLNLDDNYYSYQVLYALVQITDHNVKSDIEGTYYINYLVTDPSGNTSPQYTRLVFVGDNYQTSTGIDKVDADKLTVYPNPASSVINVDFDGVLSNDAKVEMINSVGAVVSTQPVTNFAGTQKVQVDQLPDGIYYIRMITDNQVYTQKVAIRR